MMGCFPIYLYLKKPRLRMRSFWAERGEIVAERGSKTRLPSHARPISRDSQADYQVNEFESYDRKSHLGRLESRRFDGLARFFNWSILRRKLKFSLEVGLPIFPFCRASLGLLERNQGKGVKSKYRALYPYFHNIRCCCLITMR